MNDPMMNKILKGFDHAGQQRMANKASTNGAQGSADPMLDILRNFHAVTEETINEGGEKIGGGPGAHYKPYMPGSHKMGKNSDSKHPASNYLVGGEEGDPDAGEEVISEEPIDEETLGKKQSFSDILRSFNEIENNDKEVQGKEKKKLHQNDKGTYDLAEGKSKKIKREIYIEIKDLTQLVKQCKDETLLQEVYEDILEVQYKIGQNQDIE
jgi:hypothetical protein